MKKILEGVWIILVILTIFAFMLGHLKFMPTYLVAILLISTFIKGQLVIDYFMDLKKVKLKYRLIPTIWLTAVISLIAILL
ncbi:MAG: hypothetical protein QG564_111 [Campylobacterota bacterium]|nr:hypothetical protein [Campylobacterota bacterium]